MRRAESEILIIGAGVAGLFTALKLSPRPVTVVTARRLGRGGSTPWAQGGIAAAVGADDTPALHFDDTLKAGAGLVEAAAARVLTEEGPARIEDLLGYGVPFDRAANGSLKVGREAAHSVDRVVHATGDQAGAAIMEALAEAARAADHITILERIVIEDLLTREGKVAGALAYDVEKQERFFMPAGQTVLATGGLGGLYAVTTNPVRAQGHGLAFAARAGAIIRDPEFVQFHPTALNVGIDPAPLATEALRGDGALLVNDDGRRFMGDIHPLGELAPRDIVARAVEGELTAGRGAFLDARDAVGAAFPEAYPTVFASCQHAGIDPRKDMIPIAPACHYHMGGVMTDIDGRACVNGDYDAGLWVIGEAASTGVHGANRLASNSLLEAVVFGARAADLMRDTAVEIAAAPAAPEDRLALPPSPPPADDIAALRTAMSRGAALLRSRAGLENVRNMIDALEQREKTMTSGLKSALITARIIVEGAAARRESRGGHFRSDFPEMTTPAHSHITYRKGETNVAFAPLAQIEPPQTINERQMQDRQQQDHP